MAVSPDVKRSWPAPPTESTQSSSLSQERKPFFYDALFGQELLLALENNFWRDLEVPPGDRKPVVVIPEAFHTDASTHYFRRFLNNAGYDPHVSGIKFPNIDITGNTRKITDTIKRVAEEENSQVRVVGFGWGGFQGKAVSAEIPDYVHSLSNVDGPIFGDATLSMGHFLHRAIEVSPQGPRILEDIREISAKPIPGKIKIRSVYTTDDTFAENRFAMHPNAETFVVGGSRLGLVINPKVYEYLGKGFAAEKTPSPIRSTSKITIFRASRSSSQAAA